MGGGSKSNTSSQSTSNYYDQRSVIDAGGGIVGTGNSYSADEYLASLNYSYSDRSNRSTNNTSTTLVDGSQRNSTTVDASQRTTVDARSTVDASQRTTVDASVRDNSDRSQSFTDWSNRSTTTSVDASARDFSDRSTTTTVDASARDYSDRSTITTVDARQITDGGAFDVVSKVADGIMNFGMAQTSLARDLASQADSFRAGNNDFAIQTQEAAAGFASEAAGRAFDLARSSAAQAFASSGDAIGFTRETFAETMALVGKAMDQAGMQAGAAADTAGAAYAAATNTASGNKTLLYAAMGAVALVGVVAAFRKAA